MREWGLEKHFLRMRNPPRVDLTHQGWRQGSAGPRVELEKPRLRKGRI